MKVENQLGRMDPGVMGEMLLSKKFKPHGYLTGLCLQQVQNPLNYVSGKIFPIVPVAQSSGFFREFSKADLMRDGVAGKPELGHVAPSILGSREHMYTCSVEQVLTGIDTISQVDYDRAGFTGLGNPRIAKAKWVGDQIALHLDVQWAKKYFNAEVWDNVLIGEDSPSGSGEFIKFDQSACDPVAVIGGIMSDMMERGMYEPNKMCIGKRAFDALRTHEGILDRIKYQGSEGNPAKVTEKVLASLFGLEEIVVAKALVNNAPVGQVNVEYICNPDDVLLVHTTKTPSMEEPSAGYTFMWDPLGNGQLTPTSHYEGAPSDHCELIEGLVAADHQVVCQDLAVYLSGAVTAKE
ncbi:MAG: hypothetical protein R3Y63_04125 [Eubacteriales bacterium]